MLARLQAVLVLLTVLAAAAWLAWCQQHGLGPLAMVSGVVLALVPQLPLLALEFGLLAAFGRDKAAPRASAGQLVRGWWGEVLASWRVFNWVQPFFAERQADLSGTAGQTAVLLVHGYFCNRGVWARALRHLRAQGVPCTALTLEPAFGRIGDWVPAIEATVAELTRRTGRPPVLVAHSMGGLAVRAWLAAQADAPAADARVRRIITIGTPHHGTWMARFGHSPNARQMRQGHPWLTTLAAAESARRRARFTCFFGHADNIVFPATTATLEGADNHHLAGVAHVAMVDRPEVWAEVRRWVQARPD